MTSRKRILVVDDDPLVRMMTCMTLREADESIECHEEASALVALACLEEEFDLIVSDMRMPGMTGIEFHRNIKTRCGGTRFVLMSASYLDQEAEDYVRREGVPFFEKPLTVDKIRPFLL